MISVNLKRRQLDPTQRAYVAVKIEPMFAEEAKRRMGQAGVPDRDETRGVTNSSHLSNTGRSRDLAAAVVGVGGNIVSLAKAIKRESPETFERVKSGEITVNEARRELRLARVAAQAARLMGQS